MYVCLPLVNNKQKPWQFHMSVFIFPMENNQPESQSQVFTADTRGDQVEPYRDGNQEVPWPGSYMQTRNLTVPSLCCVQCAVIEKQSCPSGI